MLTLPMKYIFFITILFLSTIAGAYNNEDLAAKVRFDNTIEISEWIIEPRLLILIERINVSKNLSSLSEQSNYIEQFSSGAKFDALNPAERYVYLVAQVLFIEKKRLFQPPSLNSKHHAKNIIELLSDINELSTLISESQLNQPSFLELQLQFHSILADQYALLEEYDLAYQERRSYLNKYDLYRGNKRKEMIDSLTDDFGINEKRLVNDSLIKKNELQVKQVDEVEKDKKSQQNNFIFIIGTALIFTIIFFKQLRVRNKLIKLARTDSLTGLLNRSALFEQGYAMTTDFSEGLYDLSVLLLDLDDFKLINDFYGHHIGDEVLKELSVLTNETMRSRDVFARLGGEEFVALLPYADNNKAKAIAQRINEKVSQHDFTAKGINEPITLSIGVATMNSNNVSFDDILHCADLAMYQAKALGKNRILSYQNIPTSQERRGI
jgi:diguanylate cyclase (GGDEF)-like protein